MRSFVYPFFLCAALSSRAQTDYLVTHKNDTLRGDLKIHSYDQLDRVQITIDKKKTYYTALQIRNISLKGEVYSPVAYENTIQLMKLVTRGYLSLYKFRLQNQSSYDGFMLKKLTGEAKEMPNLFFKKLMADFLSDCEEVSSKIGTGEFSKAEIETIVLQYNTCIENKTRENTPSATIAEGSNPASEAIEKLKAKIEASSIESRKDALDLLNDLSLKVKRKEAVPKYLTEGLKSYLGEEAEFAEDLLQVLALVKD